ncbi:DUF1501 domain-containing protein [Lignipirellula cremea]|uniref:DUF1501 domain-containing protein n=1 Tax=Lignipirellula cremea TaxID=2528010 RepID=A0A518DKD0_9BACT|nr:DUF1501 domain-containing protein [Lignipirellula cremea]QDU92292.1 hypothetical protein Pla8534_00370 [Lignipirellula cremea]
MNQNNHRCPGPTRRSFLKMGTLGLSGLSLAEVMRLRAAAGATIAAPDTSVIFVWLAGGPAHMDTYDMKPDAPEEYRGEFRPMGTNVPGMDVCELFPLHAQCADKYTLIRSIAHTFSDHGGGSKRVMTGRIPKTPTGTVNDAPSAISIVSKMRERIEMGLPNTICVSDGGRSKVDTYAQGAAYLGMKYNYFPVGGNPGDPNFEVRNLFLNKEIADRLDDRRLLLGQLDRLRREVDASGAMDAVDEFSQKSFSLMTSERAHEAFDLSQEPQALRERYGQHKWGQRALLARRLVEAGCSFVTVVMENPNVPGGFYNWDSHAVNTHIWRDSRGRFPIYDKAITALIEDLHDRGLTKKVLLVVTGEFGRSPRVSQAEKKGVIQPGREHWPGAMSVLVCGGGMQHGQVIGSTNAKGEHPHDRPLTPNDLWATVYKHLGINQDATITDYTGRPQMLLPFGEPIRELL